MDGFLNVLKPRGATSHDVVMLARKFLREDRLGHLGTLDPLAVGVLPLACGNYRRLSEYFLGEDKRYFAEFTLGVRTDTGDAEGRVVDDRDASDVTPDAVRSALPALTGVILQTPPAYSALKVGGRKLLNLARRGIEVEREAREVTVHEFKLAGWTPGAHPKALFSLRVGHGTYVRSLAFSLGDSLGCGATVSYLLRSRVGRFSLGDSLTLSELRALAKSGRGESALVPPLTVLPAYPLLAPGPGAIDKIAHGVSITMDDVAPAEGRRPSEPNSDELGSLTAPGVIRGDARTDLPEIVSCAGSGQGSIQETQPGIGRFPCRAIVAMPDGRGVSAVVSVQSDGRLVYEKVMISKG